MGKMDEDMTKEEYQAQEEFKEKMAMYHKEMKLNEKKMEEEIRRSDFNLGLFSDKKKLSRKIKALTELATKGNKKGGKKEVAKEENGTNAIFKKIYSALKEEEKIPLDIVDIDVFDDGYYGAFKTSNNFFIAKAGNSFSLFKAKEVETISNSDIAKLKKNLKQTLKEKKISSENQKEFIESHPLVTLKNLSKEDIATKVFELSENEEETKNAILQFIGKEENSKLLKKDIANLSILELNLIAHNYFCLDDENPESNENAFSKFVSAFTIDEEKEKTELQLVRGANIEMLTRETLLPIKERVEKIEEQIYTYFEEKENVSTTMVDNPEKRSENIFRITLAILTLKGELSEIEKELDTLVADPTIFDIVKASREIENRSKALALDDTIQMQLKVTSPIKLDESFFKNKPQEREEEYMKVDLLPKKDLIDTLKETPLLQEEFGVSLEKEIKITNYGVFTHTSPKQALSNLILYANTLNEVLSKNFQEKKNAPKEETKEAHLLMRY